MTRLALSIPTRLAPPARTRLLARLWAAMALGRSRRGLAQLDDHILRDVGITRAEALREAGRPGWDAPAHWLL